MSIAERMLPKLALAALGCVATVALGARAENQSPAPTQASRQFDVASVKPCEMPAPGPGGRGGGGSDFRASPTTLQLTCMRVASMVDTAYVQFGAKRAKGDPLDAWSLFSGAQYNGQATEPQRVRGGPSWAYSDRYTIEAKTDAAATRATMMGPMLRALLEERFKLKIHQDTEPAPMWALTVAKGGLKIKPMKDGDCDPDRARSVLMSDAVKTGAKPTCGMMNGEPNGGNWRNEHAGQDFSAVASLLSMDLGDMVIDRTGVTDKFMFMWEYAPDERTPTSLASHQRIAPKAGAATARDIFTALEEQVGLKLERIKGPRGFLVIDRVERPTPNDPFFAAPPRSNLAGR